MRQLLHFRARPCDNKKCTWHKTERNIDKKNLQVVEDGSIFVVGTFMCECTFHVRVEPVWMEVEG